jgi:hypothetical protein
MGSPTVYKEIIDGRLIVVRPRRGYVEALVYPGENEKGDPVAEWEMPNQLRYDLDLVARQAALQTARSENNEGDND